MEDINKNLNSELAKNENNLEEKDNINLYYLKIYGRKDTFGINNIFKKFVLNLEK